MTLRLIPIPILIACFLLWLSDPPEAVRLRNFKGCSGHEKMAAVPVCYGNYPLKLGSSAEEVSEQSGRILELSSCELSDMEIAEWKDIHEGLAADSLVQCVFNKGKLAAVKILTTSEIAFPSKEELLQSFSAVHPCLPEVFPVLNYGTNVCFEEENLAFRQSIKLVKRGERYSGLIYELAYPEAGKSIPDVNS